MTIKIEQMREQDLEATIECCVSCFGEDWRQIASKDLPDCFSNGYYKPYAYIAKDGEKVVGLIVISEILLEPDIHTITWVGVDEPYRGERLGQKLIERCEEHARDKIYFKDTAMLMLSSGIDPTYYENMGFAVLGESHLNFPIMVKTISKV